MAELTLISKQSRPLRSLVEAALANELRSVEAAIDRTENRLREFETTYGLDTATFIARFENDELGETLEFVDWVGEYRLLTHLREKAETFQGIEIEN